MPSSTPKSPPHPDSSPPLSPSHVPTSKLAREHRLLSLFLPSPPFSSPPRPLESATFIAPPSTETSTKHLLLLIAEFLRSDHYLHGSVDLEVPFVSRDKHRSLLRELQHPRLLTGKEADSLRYDYSPETATLTLACMPSPVHDSGLDFAGDVLLEMRETNTLSRNERCSILVNAGTDVALPTLSSLSRAGSKRGGTAVKQPDAAYYFIDRTSPTGSDRCPRVVYEIAFSQSYESVCQDAKHWLLRAGGFVKLVILVKLTEGDHPEAEIDHDEIAIKEREQIRALGVPRDSPRRDTESPKPAVEIPKPDAPTVESDTDSLPPASPTSSQSSTALDYDNYFKSDPSPWVGPISGFLELYRYDAASKTVYQDGPRCDIFNPVPADVVPKIKITDLLPLSHIEGNPDREFALPLEMYRYQISVGVHKLAANRRASSHVVRRKRKVADNSGAFLPPVVAAEEVVVDVQDGGRKRMRRGVEDGAR